MRAGWLAEQLPPPAYLFASQPAASHRTYADATPSAVVEDARGVREGEASRAKTGHNQISCPTTAAAGRRAVLLPFLKKAEPEAASHGVSAA